MLSSRDFVAMGVRTTVVVEHEAALEPVFDVVREIIVAVDETCSRFKPVSELSLLNAAAGSGPAAVSPLLFSAITATLEAADATDGLVDPTVGRLVERAGYTVTYRDLTLDGPPLTLVVQPAAGWRTVVCDERARTVELQQGVAIDIGAVGKAWAADRAATVAATSAGCGVLVCCGGDVAVAGPEPSGGWPVRVAEMPDAAARQDVYLHDGGIATSGPGSRSWRRGRRVYHHIIDPQTGLPAPSPWRVVTVAAATCADANAAATAALIVGDGAIDWLGKRQLPARLVDNTGAVRTVGAWPPDPAAS